MNILSNTIAHHTLVIKELEFNRCNLSHESIKILTNALLKCSGGPLESISLNSNTSNYEGLGQTILALKGGKHIRRLNIWENNEER